MCRGCIAARARLPLFAASHNFWTSSWNCSRLTWELIWQTGLSSGSVWKLNLMKAHTAKTCRLTSAPDFSYNRLHSLVKGKLHSSCLPGVLSLTWAAALYDLLCVMRGPSPAGLRNPSKNKVCNFKTTDLSKQMKTFFIPWSCFSDTCINTEYKDKHKLSSSSADKSLCLFMRQLIYSFSRSHSTRLVWLCVGRCTLVFKWFFWGSFYKYTQDDCYDYRLASD